MTVFLIHFALTTWGMWIVVYTPLVRKLRRAKDGLGGAMSADIEAQKGGVYVTGQRSAQDAQQAYGKDPLPLTVAAPS
jgi:hypothetical protein